VVQAHRLGHSFDYEHLECIHYTVYKLRQIFHLVFAEVGQDIVGHVAVQWFSYPDSQAVVIPGAKLLMKRPQTVMPAMSAIGLELDLAERDIQFVMDDDKVARHKLVKPKRFGDGASGKVHVCLGFQEKKPVPLELPFAVKPAEALPRSRYSRQGSKSIQNYETRIVAGP